MSSIVQTGSFLGGKAYSNDSFIEEFAIDSTDEWITSRTGIRQRYIADGSSVSDLAQAASENLFGGLADEVKNKITLVIVASMSSYLPTPSVAADLIRRLDLQQAFGYDLSGACTGFIMALEMANSVAQSQEGTYTLIVGAEKMSDIIDYNDRTTSVLFGDGAGAVLIKNNGQSLPDYHSHIRNTGDLNQVITNSQKEKFQMKGRDVFNFVKRTVIPTMKDFIELNALNPDFILCHQANERLIDIIRHKLNRSEASLPTNLNSVANTSAASIPLLLDQLVKESQVQLESGQKLILSGFGGGLSYGHIYFRI